MSDEGRPRLPVNVASMSDLDDDHRQHIIFDFINDPIVALPHPVSILTSQLFASGRPRLRGERTYSTNNALADCFLRNGLEFFESRAF